ncbi:MAG: hypothetical protein R2824_15520 [Saprospiraceae bacterium]|nr:hypothetical protein [Lewinella sp.]
MRKNALAKSTTVQLLKALDAGEFKDFARWLRSSWCSSNQHLITLYRILKKHYPEFSSERLTKQWLYAEIYPGKAYNDKVCRNLLSELSVQIREFLVLKRVRKDPLLFQKTLISEYQNRIKPDWFIKESKKLLDQIEEQQPQNWENRLDCLVLNEQLYFSPHTLYRQQKNPGPLEAAAQALEEFYLLGKLRILNERLERRKKFAQQEGKKDQQLDTSFLTSEAVNEIVKNPVFNIYYQRILNRDLSLEMQFERSEQLFRSTVDQLPDKDQQILYHYLLNDTARLSQKGNTQILTRMLDLYKFGIDQNLLIYDQKITESTFLNIVSLAAGLKDFDFLEQFIPACLILLPASSIDDAHTWAKAKVALEQDKYEQCIEILKDYSFQGFVFIYRTRFLLLQAFFEQFLRDDTYYPFFKSYCRRTEMNMRNEKRLSQARKTAVIKFTQYIRKMAKWKDDVNATGEQLDRIVEDLEKERNIQGKFWLKAKLDQISKKLL